MVKKSKTFIETNPVYSSNSGFLIRLVKKLCFFQKLSTIPKQNVCFKII